LGFTSANDGLAALVNEFEKNGWRRSAPEQEQRKNAIK
jgi:hypothetical protein